MKFKYLYHQMIEKAMKLLQIFLLIIVVLGPFGKAVLAQQTQSDSLTLHKAIRLALTNQPSLKQVQAQINAAKAQVGQAKSARYPHLNAKGDVTYLSPVSSLILNGETFQIEPKKNYNIHLAAQQLIYNFGKTQANIQLAKSRTLTAEQQAEVVKWTVSYFTAQTFYSVLFEEQNIKVVNKQLNQLKSDLDIAQKKQRAGAATNYDVLTIKVRIAEVKNQKRDLQNQREKLKITLRRLFGWKSTRPVPVAGVLNTKPVQHISGLKAIYKNRPDYQVLLKKEKALQQAYKVSNLSNRPQLTAGGTAGFKNGYVPDLNEVLGNYTIGLHLTIPIFSGFSRHYRQQEAKANIHSAKAATLKLQRQIQADISKAESDVQTGKEKLSTAHLQIEHAEEGLGLARIRYKNGAITSNDLLAAETALTQARFQRVTTIYNILLSQYDLKKAMGVKIW
jgi:outer membrane protein TolC